MYKIYNKNTKIRQIKTNTRFSLYTTLGLMIETTANFALALRFNPITL